MLYFQVRRLNQCISSPFSMTTAMEQLIIIIRLTITRTMTRASGFNKVYLERIEKYPNINPFETCHLKLESVSDIYL